MRPLDASFEQLHALDDRFMNSVTGRQSCCTELWKPQHLHQCWRSMKKENCGNKKVQFFVNDKTTQPSLTSGSQCQKQFGSAFCRRGSLNLGDHESFSMKGGGLHDALHHRMPKLIVTQKIEQSAVHFPLSESLITSSACFLQKSSSSLKVKPTCDSRFKQTFTCFMTKT